MNEDRLGQHWGNGIPARGVHPVGHLIESVAEKVPVLIQGHSRRGVAEHLLNDLHIRAGRDRQRSCGVPEFVRVQA